MREVDQELFDAVEQGNLSRVKRCIDRGANIYAIKNYMVQLTGTALRDFMVDFP
ncbi:MAG: hypothetical protein LKM45_04465 [Wolbachia endosymbiont of Alcedoecus sp.]|nr:hypothetical protein [Wolbachia endosymbiont of Alcedoecus sp.]